MLSSGFMSVIMMIMMIPVAVVSEGQSFVCVAERPVPIVPSDCQAMGQTVGVDSAIFQ